jgi:dTDP-glucose pyrophosphorylase
MKIEKYIVSESVNIRSAIKQMDKCGIGFIAISDDKENIIGIVTDGDFRRSILKGIQLKECVEKITNRDFIFLGENYTYEDVDAILSSSDANHIPVLEDGKLLEIITDENNFGINKTKRTQMLDNPVVIMAGGMGTRLDPFTRILPKPLIPIGHDPIIKVIMDEFGSYGMKQYFLTINEKGRMIKAYFYDHDLDYDIKFIEEDKPLGTAGSLKLMSETISETFFVSNCDIIIKCDYSKILNFHQERQNAITMVGSMRHHIVPYGVCEIENGGDLTAIIEKPEYDYLTNTGLYIIEPKALELIPENIRFDMTDLIVKTQKSGLRVGVFPVSEKSWIDIGQSKDYNLAISDFNKYPRKKI